MDTIYAANGLTIYADAAQRCLLIDWQGKHSGPEKEACCQHIVQAIHRTQSTKMLVDGSHDLDTWAEAVHWIGHEYYHTLLASSLEAVAWVLPRNVRALADVNRVLSIVHHLKNRPNQQLVIDTFHDIESAHAWLHRLVGA
ncbi:hypothetical protein [Hymenobacter cheonanensis]|uniref:hypothetical protein n=1 Tax=Hymenobacter sp. CA2-7 TaxID=3063993 RepID=UPI0027123AFA|nr:hypothetical protein [Hymenobacter sp. CA2-7]MDO7885866.1 hypothetical protein [Hymenobacter sp. CA2-7]